MNDCRLALPVWAVVPPAVIELLGEFLLSNPLVLSYFGRATTPRTWRAVETYDLRVLGHAYFDAITTFGPKARIRLGRVIDAGVGSGPRSLGGGGRSSLLLSSHVGGGVLGNRYTES